MSTLDVTRAELILVVLYLNKTEVRDKICRAKQYGLKFLSNGQPGTTQTVDKNTSLARKVFCLFKFVNDLHALISPTLQGNPLPLVLQGKTKNALVSTFLFLDTFNFIYVQCLLGSSVCTSLVEIGELGRLSSSMKKLEKNIDAGDKTQVMLEKNTCWSLLAGLCRCRCCCVVWKVGGAMPVAVCCWFGSCSECAGSRLSL